jgi:excisionase family DNA binding protein
MTLLTVDEAATQLRVHPETIRRMIKRGELAAVRAGSVYRIPADELAPKRVEPTPRASVDDPSPLARFARPEWRRPERRA